MTFGSSGGNGKKSECRALVPLEHQGGSSTNALTRADAPFVVQLAANAKGFAAYRAKRRADPAYGAHRYRATTARSAVLPGGKLNYCA